MKPMDELIAEIVAGLLAPETAPGLTLAVTGLEVALPVEAVIGSGGRLWLSPPRGIMRTGFAMPHGRLRLGCSAH